MKRVLVTGASGLLGRTLVKMLCEKTDHAVYAVTQHPEAAVFNQLSFGERLHIQSNAEMFSKESAKWGIDQVINCAFARSNDPQQLASALDYTRRLVEMMNETEIQDLINISSQGVYKRQPSGVLVNENAEIEPIDLYSMCKYATEQIICGSIHGFCTNVRLSSLNMDGRFLPKFVENAKRSGEISLSAPGMQASLMDVRDAADALVCLAQLNSEKRSDVYNIGVGYQLSLLEYAEVVKKIGKEFGYQITITLTDNKTAAHSGMDCGRLFHDLSWKPQYTPEIMVRELFCR